VKRILVICLGLLFLLAAGCDSKKESVSTNSPEGVVKGYYDALKGGKPDVAYGYLKAPWSKTKEVFVQEKKSGGMMFKDFTVQKAQIKGTTGTVPVIFKTGVATMPEMTMNVQVEKGKTWVITSLGMSGGTGMGGTTSGNTYGTPPAGMGGGMPGGVPGGTPPAGMGGGTPPAGMPPSN
jgi:hypothetical protein